MALHKCRNVGCMKLIPLQQPYCADHEKRPRTVGRVLHYNTKKRAAEYDHRWSVISADYRKNNPHCVVCLKGKTFTPVDLVDHIIPVRICVSTGRAELIYDPNNLQSLCHKHHRYKTMDDQLKYPELI